MSTVSLQGYILVPEGELATVSEALQEHIALTRNEPGCLTFDVDPDPDNLLRFNVRETFASAEAFEYQQRRVQSSAWGQLTTNVQRHYTIDFDSPAATHTGATLMPGASGPEGE